VQVRIGNDPDLSICGSTAMFCDHKMATHPAPVRRNRRAAPQSLAPETKMAERPTVFMWSRAWWC